MITPLPNSRPLRTHLQENVVHLGIVTPSFHTIWNIMDAALVMILLLVIQIVITGVHQAIGKSGRTKSIPKQSPTSIILELNQIGNTGALDLIMSDRG